MVDATRAYDNRTDLALRRLATSDAHHCSLVGIASRGLSPPGGSSPRVMAEPLDDPWRTPRVARRRGFPRCANGWAVGTGGLVLATSNGGTSWIGDVAVVTTTSTL